MKVPNQKPVLGLIGGIGSGKSSVAAELARHGGCLIDGDKLGHEALHQKEIQGKIGARWGNGLMDEKGLVDRRRLGAIVFGDEKELQALEEMVFPFIEKRIQEEMDRARQDPHPGFIVLDAAIMLEAGWSRRCDRLVFVDAPRELRLERLKKQRGWTEKDLQVREKVQMSLDEKKRHADWVIENNGSPEEIARQVMKMMQTLGLPPSS